MPGQAQETDTSSCAIVRSFADLGRCINGRAEVKGLKADLEQQLKEFNTTGGTLEFELNQTCGGRNITLRMNGEVFRL